VLDINVWSGLTYEGTFKMGEYEKTGRREMRFRALLEQIRKNDPDVIFIQEANPVRKYASRLADSLSYDEIHFVCNAGIKLGPVGIPSNLSEGQVILAKRKFHLEEVEIWKHSGSPGINSDYLNIHFDESIYTLVGKIKINGKPLYVVNTHLYSVVPMNSNLKNIMDEQYKTGRISAEEYDDAYTRWEDGVMRQKNEMKDLIERLKELPKEIPIIIGGDFNADTGSEGIKTLERYGFINTLPYGNLQNKRTWDLQKNSNARYEFIHDMNQSRTYNVYDSISSYYDQTPRNIDHIFVDKKFSKEDIISNEVTIDSLLYGVHASDHFGIISEINVTHALSKTPEESDELQQLSYSKLEPLPILTYDTDIGFGYGAKIFLLNKLKHNESSSRIKVLYEYICCQA
jgi:endonuclease/exonuclease/phosphatase family metal-dependent hydrolase